MTPIQATKIVLHVGCGTYHASKLHPLFRGGDWQEIRLDINPDVRPDIIGSITNMHTVASESVDAVWSAHNLEHVFPHEVPVVLREFLRVLKPGGFALVNVPDIQAAAEYIAQGNLEGPLYESPNGPISAIDILYGHRPALESGGFYMAHKTGFTADSIEKRFVEVGFEKVTVRKTDFNLWAMGYKLASDSI